MWRAHSARRSTSTMSPRACSVQVDVVGQAQPFVETAQVATNFKQQLMADLPSNRTIDAVLLMAPAVHPTGPRGAYTINGSQSYENLYMLNGAVINENLRGAADDPVHRGLAPGSDGRQRRDFRRIRAICRRRRHRGDQVGRQPIQRIVPDDVRQRQLAVVYPVRVDRSHQQPVAKPSDLKLDVTVPVYEATFGGPLQTDHLWFFAAMRSQEQQSKRTTVGTNIPYNFVNDEQRYEGKLTYTPKSGQSLQGTYLKLNQVLDQNNSGFNVADLRVSPGRVSRRASCRCNTPG